MIRREGGAPWPSKLSSPNTLKFFLQCFCCLSDNLHILFLFAFPRTLGEFVALNLNFHSPLPQWTWNWFPPQTDCSTDSQGVTTYLGETWVPQNMIKAMDPLSQKLHARTFILSTALGGFIDPAPFTTTTTTKNHLESVLKGKKKSPFIAKNLMLSEDKQLNHPVFFAVFYCSINHQNWSR